MRSDLRPGGAGPTPEGGIGSCHSPREAAAAACTLVYHSENNAPGRGSSTRWELEEGIEERRKIPPQGHVTSCRSGGSCQAIKSFFYLQPKTTTDGPGRTGDPPGPGQPPPFPADKI